jgi:transposase
MVYSEDFRKKVMGHIDAYKTQAEVARMFNISSKTLYNWINQRRETGNLKPKKPIRVAIKLKEEHLRQYVKDHPDAYLREIAEHFGCANSEVHRRLKQLGITRKKKLF